MIVKNSINKPTGIIYAPDCCVRCNYIVYDVDYRQCRRCLWCDSCGEKHEWED